MSNSYDEIKKLLKASNNMLKGQNIFESEDEIKKSYGMISEQDIASRMNPVKSAEEEIEDDYEEYETADDSREDKESPGDRQQSYRISGGIITLHGKEKVDIELTTDEKTAFQETMDEFVNEVSDLTDFNALNVYKTDVEWGGKVIDYDIDFYFTIGESNGIYINGTMIKIDENFLEMLNKLQSFYEKFKNKWAKILASRKKTKLNNTGENEE